MKVSLDGVARYWSCTDVNYLVVPGIGHSDGLIITSNYIHIQIRGYACHILLI
jgi:hypothetical protein